MDKKQENPFRIMPSGSDPVSVIKLCEQNLYSSAFSYQIKNFSCVQVCWYKHNDLGLNYVIIQLKREHCPKVDLCFKSAVKNNMP